MNSRELTHDKKNKQKMIQKTNGSSEIITKFSLSNESNDFDTKTQMGYQKSSQKFHFQAKAMIFITR